MVALRGEVDLGVETQLPVVPMVTLGRSGLGLSRRKMLPNRLVGGVGSVQAEAAHPPPLTKVAGEGQCPGEVPAPISPLPLPPSVGSWS
jgi:hypothetical protein